MLISYIFCSSETLSFFSFGFLLFCFSTAFVYYELSSNFGVFSGRASSTIGMACSPPCKIFSSLVSRLGISYYFRGVDLQLSYTYYAGIKSLVQKFRRCPVVPMYALYNAPHYGAITQKITNCEPETHSVTWTQIYFRISMRNIYEEG